MPFDHDMDQINNHRQAAQRLAAQLNWVGEYQGGSAEEGFVWVNTRDAELRFTVTFKEPPVSL